MTIANDHAGMTEAAPSEARPEAGVRSAAVLAYHRRTKHRRDGYAAGPETLDWDAQPSPYRHFAGAPITPLPLVSDSIPAPFAAITGQAQVSPAVPDIQGVAALLELAFGLAAIKEYGPDRWALRCNPSSGNLHPTEAYVLACGIAGLPDGLHHYRPEDHVLEQRCAARLSRSGLWIGLSSIQWREAWKYGERAFRYCQLDAGHALGAIAAACAAIGWRAGPVSGANYQVIADLLGLGREQDFGRTEREEPEVLVHIETLPQASRTDGDGAPAYSGDADWTGFANLLDPRPMYRWPVIDEAAAASRGDMQAPELHGCAPQVPAPPKRAAEVILGRRSAQRYARDHIMPQADFRRLLASAAGLGREAGLNFLAFVHNVEGLPRGLYGLCPDPRTGAAFRAALDGRMAWQDVPGIPEVSAFKLLAEGDFRKAVRAISCHQAIAADASVLFSMLGGLGDRVRSDPSRYRLLHWQAGLIGQRLYLEAEALGHSGTGIGCFLDDELHELVGLRDDTFQVLYQFAVGRGVTDSRIIGQSAYPGRSRMEAGIEALDQGKDETGSGETGSGQVSARG